MSYFPSRIDTIYSDDSGTVKSVSGIASELSSVPEVLTNGIPLYNVEVLPYTYDTNDVVVSKVGES